MDTVNLEFVNAENYISITYKREGGKVRRNKREVHNKVLSQASGIKGEYQGLHTESLLLASSFLQSSILGLDRSHDWG